MLDVRPLYYVSPLTEQEIGPITPVIRLRNLADEDATVTGLFRIYRDSTGLLEYSSDLAVTPLAHGTSADIPALTPFSPGAVADDDYFVICELEYHSIQTGNVTRGTLGPFYFDTKAPPMGPVPTGHHTTHEAAGMDEIDLAGMSGLLADPQTPETHAGTHEDGQADEVNVEGLHGELADDQPALAHDIAGARHTSTATPAQLLQADANGLPVDATNTDADVAAAVGASHARQHAVDAAADHTSTATPGKMLKAAATTGLPAEAANTDAEVSAAVSASHSNANDPSANQKAALVGTGTPGDGDRYVNNSDARMTDARTPVAHNQSATTITAGTATGPIAVTGSYNSTLKVDTVVANAVTVNWAEGNVHRIVLPSGATTVTMTNPTTGIRGCIIFVQPPSGAAGTIVLSPTVKTAGGLGITLSSANNAVDDVYLLYDGTGAAYHAMAALAWA